MAMGGEEGCMRQVGTHLSKSKGVGGFLLLREGGNRRMGERAEDLLESSGLGNDLCFSS
jgi:hypothetical protein